MPYLKEFRLPRPGDRGETQIIQDVLQYGWHVLGVSADPGKTDPPFSYSIGLYYTFGHPEVVITGLPHKTAHSIINAVVERLQSVGPFVPNVRTGQVLEAHDIVMRQVSPELYPPYLGYAMWFYRDISSEFPALQVVWPDKGGRFPWEPGFDPSLLSSQFMLDVSA